MKSIGFTMLSSLALALLGPCFGTGLAYAQGHTGKFTLPFEVRWGLATLQPGDYSFTLGKAPDSLLYVYSGRKGVALICAMTSDDRAPDRPKLTVVRDKTVATVREMSLPGVVLYYRMHKPKRGTALDERATAMAIPIAITAAAR